MEVRKGYKQTEVGVIPEDWDLKSLSALTKEIGDGIHATPEYVDTSEYYFINGNNLLNGQVLITDNTMSVSETEYKRLKKSLDKNTILMSINGTIGNMAFYDGEKVVLGKSAAYININQENSKVFLYFALQSHAIKTYFENELTGTTIRNLSLGSIRNTPIPLPPTLAEQEAIAEALSDADALIESLESLLAKKRQVKQGAMSELLTEKRRVVESPTGRLRTGEWEEKKLSDVCWYQEGPGVRTWQFTKSGIKLLNGTNIFRGEINLDNTDRFISENLAYGQYAHFMADSGDIVIASSGITVEKFEEKVAFVRDEHLPLCMNTSTIRFKANKNVLQSSFLYFLLMSDLFKKQIGHQATGSAQLNFGPAHLNKVLFNLPDLAEQTAIAEILNDMDAEITALEAKLSKARDVKAGMMSELLTGRVRFAP